MKRRDFISNSCAACLGVIGVQQLLSGCQTSKYLSKQLDKDGLTIDLSDFEIKKNGSTNYHKYIIVSSEELRFPICIYRFSSTDYSALWMQCAHQGAEVQVVGTHLQCPAHGSEYDSRGQVTNGPAETGLRTFPVVVSALSLFIDLRKKA